jgi:4-hydroxy-2-oxoheptanedioate aldolase
MDNGGAFEEARVRIAEACARHGVVAGIHASAALAAKHAAAGYRMITVSHDISAMVSGAAGDLATVRGAAGGTQPVYR